VAGSDTETRLPIGVAALLILVIECAADRGQRGEAGGAARQVTDVYGPGNRNHAGGWVLL
jgi:hypothetical protein